MNNARWKRHELGPLTAWGDAGNRNSGPVLLIQPGAGSQAASFRNFVEAFTGPALAIDLPGHGANAGPLLTTIREMAEAVEAAISALSRPVVLLGHSMGGAVAIEVALRRQARLEGLILYSTGARLRVSPALIRNLETNYHVHNRESARYSFGSGVTDEILDRYLELPRHPANVQVLNDFRAADRFDRMNDISSLGGPVLVIGGDSDNLTPAKYQAYLAEKIPGSKRVILFGAGHMGHLEKPREFSAALREFIRSVGGGGIP